MSRTSAKATPEPAEAPDICGHGEIITEYAICRLHITLFSRRYGAYVLIQLATPR